jgi:hypothetical protein
LRPLSGVSVPLASDLAESLRSRCYKSGPTPGYFVHQQSHERRHSRNRHMTRRLNVLRLPLRIGPRSGHVRLYVTDWLTAIRAAFLVALTRLRMCVRSSIARRERCRNNLLGNAVLACFRERHSFPVGFLQGTLGAFGAVPLPSATPTPRWVRHVTDNGEMPLAGAPPRHCRQPGYSGPSWKIPLEDAFPCPRGLIAFSSHRAATRKSISTGRYP